jgi:hypothetical protein
VEAFESRKAFLTLNKIFCNKTEWKQSAPPYRDPCPEERAKILSAAGGRRCIPVFRNRFRIYSEISNDT